MVARRGQRKSNTIYVVKWLFELLNMPIIQCTVSVKYIRYLQQASKCSFPSSMARLRSGPLESFPNHTYTSDTKSNSRICTSRPNGNVLMPQTTSLSAGLYHSEILHCQVLSILLVTVSH